MTVVFSDSDWDFIEARLLSNPQYKDPEVFAKASPYIRRGVRHLVNETFPKCVERQAGHVGAGDEAKARVAVIQGLDVISQKIERWGNLPESSPFFEQVEYEVQGEMDRSHDLEFSPGTLLALIKRYQRGATRAEANRLAYIERGRGNHRHDTITHEVFAMGLARLWEEATGYPPKTSNNSGFHKLINYLYDLLGHPNRGVSSLNRDLEKYFRRLAGKTPTKFLK